MAPLASSGSPYPAASPPLPLGSAHPHSHPHPGRASQMIAKGLSQRRGLHMTAAPAAQGWGQLEVEAHSRGDPIRNSPSKPSSAHCPLCKKKKKKKVKSIDSLGILRQSGKQSREEGRGVGCRTGQGPRSAGTAPLSQCPMPEALSLC